VSLLRAATPDDLDAVLALERCCEGAPHWSEAAWQQTLSSQSAESIVILAELPGKLLGFIAVSRVLDVVSLDSVAVDAAARGQSIGRSLVLAGLRWAQEHEAQSMELEVRLSNTAARGLYAALGFLEQGRRKSYYAAPVEDAVLMAVAVVKEHGETAKV
jgi:ribosomal-protein-alanine N-acetyltransferase